MTILDTYNTQIEMLGKRFEQFPWEKPDKYACWLAQTYYFVKNSTRLITLTGSLFNHEFEEYHQRFTEYSSEEANHDIMALSDLKKLGYDISSIPELPETSSFWQSQYYWIMAQHPISFYGYILSLEGLAVTVAPKVYERVKSVYGAKGTTFLKVHVAEDIGHMENAMKFINKIPATYHPYVINNLKECCSKYSQILTRAAEFEYTGSRVSAETNEHLAI